jgi:diaminopimelate dehydrogenase
LTQVFTLERPDFTLPALTAQVLVNVARATFRLQPGCYTMPEIPVIDMLPGTREEIVATLV